MTDDHHDATRRRVLARLGLAAGALYAAPALLPLTQARASSFSSFSGVAPRRRAATPPPPRPEIVVSATQGGDIDAIVAEGYELVARAPVGLADSELARFVVPANLTVEQARAQIAGLAPTALFDLNAIYRPEEMPCGPEGCAAFELIGWRSQAPACEAEIAIGMIDTTVNADHAGLAGVEIDRFPVIADGRRPGSAVHGTAVAILMAGRTDSRTPGLLSRVRLVAAEAFHSDAAGQDAADTFDIVRAIDAVVGRGAQVINLSFTGPDNAVLQAAVAAAVERGVILVAAAGNAGPNAEPLFPAAYDGVVAVTAIDRDGNVYRRANAGDHIDFAAPGVQLWTAASVSGGRFRSGTSYAAPFVTAALAAMRAERPDVEARVLVEDLANGARDLGEAGRDDTFGWGLVQAPSSCRSAGTIFPASGG